MKYAVVFVSYLKVPEERLQDHFVWNAEAYRDIEDRLTVYVVSDTDHKLPSYAECVIYPLDRLPLIGGQRRFSLTRTKNAGIQKAIDDGANVIVCTDVDIAFGGCLRFVLDVGAREAHVPVYLMAEDESGRNGHADNGCTGTVSMTADNWRRIQYEEECIGYGADDGILLRDIQRAGLRIRRDYVVTHVAHVTGDGQRTPGSGSATCWGRDDGFNFDNFHNNRRLHRGRR